MKRKDALRKLRTICQRLDEFDPNDFSVQPLRLYLYGSILTDKPNPGDLDLVLVYEFTPDVDYARIVAEMTHGRATPPERVVFHLRRNMQMVRIEPVRTSIQNWMQSALLFFTTPRLIWQPTGNWPRVLSEIETSPLPWDGDRDPDAAALTETLIEQMPEDEYRTRLAQLLASLEAQVLSHRTY